jgi:AmmeMemoRadiSam system protein A
VQGDGAEPDADFVAATRRLLDAHGLALLRTAASSIEHGLFNGRPLPVEAGDHPEELRSPGACFVTLTSSGRLRGCVGSAEAYRPLVEDVADNGFSAAFLDSRFPELAIDERFSLRISISVLSRPQSLDFIDEDDLVRQLLPGRDGLIIKANGRRALFLPQVWVSFCEPREFLAHLKEKAGLARDHWSRDIAAWRFVAESVSTDALTIGSIWS